MFQFPVGKCSTKLTEMKIILSKFCKSDLKKVVFKDNRHHSLIFNCDISKSHLVMTITRMACATLFKRDFFISDKHVVCLSYQKQLAAALLAEWFS